MLETDDYFKNNKLTKHLEFKELSFVEKYLHIQFQLFVQLKELNAT